MCPSPISRCYRRHKRVDWVLCMGRLKALLAINMPSKNPLGRGLDDVIFTLHQEGMRVIAGVNDKLLNTGLTASSFLSRTTFPLREPDWRVKLIPE